MASGWVWGDCELKWLHQEEKMEDSRERWERIVGCSQLYSLGQLNRVVYSESGEKVFITDREEEQSKEKVSKTKQTAGY